MLSRVILMLGVAVATSFAIPVQSDAKKNTSATQIESINAELAAVLDESVYASRLDMLAAQLTDIQYEQAEMIDRLEKLSKDLRAPKPAKFVTKGDLQEAVAVTKSAVAEAQFCDCNCSAKLTDLERRVADLEAQLLKVSAAPKVGGSGSTGSTVTSSYVVQSPPVVVSSGGSTGSYTVNSYASQPVYSEPVYSYSQPQTTNIDLPEQTRTVRVVEPRTRRSVSYAEVPMNSDVNLSVASPSNCYIDANGQQVCPTSSTSVNVQASRGWRPGDVLLGRRR